MSAKSHLHTVKENMTLVEAEEGRIMHLGSTYVTLEIVESARGVSEEDATRDTTDMLETTQSA